MINIAVAGCGYWGPNLIRNFIENRDCRVTHCCDSSKDSVDKVIRSYPYIKGVSDYGEIISSPEIDAVVIATPVKTHFELSKKALMSGKHVLVEKPLAFSSSEAMELIELSEKMGKVLMTGHTFEFNPAVKMLKDIIRSTAVGTPLYFYSTRVNLGIIRDDINSMWNLAPHDISILIYLMEEFPVAVSAFGKSFIQKGIEDVVFMYIEFPSGAVAHVHTSWLDPSKVRKLTVVCEKKMVVYDDVDNEAKLKIYDKGFETKLATDGGIRDYIIRPRAGAIFIPKVDNTEPLKIECSHFIECIMNGKRPLTDGLNGMRVVNVLETAGASLKDCGVRKETDWKRLSL